MLTVTTMLLGGAGIASGSKVSTGRPWTYKKVTCRAFGDKMPQALSDRHDALTKDFTPIQKKYHEANPLDVLNEWEVPIGWVIKGPSSGGSGGVQERYITLTISAITENGMPHRPVINWYREQDETPKASLELPFQQCEPEEGVCLYALNTHKSNTFTFHGRRWGFCGFRCDGSLTLFFPDKDKSARHLMFYNKYNKALNYWMKWHHIRSIDEVNYFHNKKSDTKPEPEEKEDPNANIVGAVEALDELVGFVNHADTGDEKAKKYLESNNLGGNFLTSCLVAAGLVDRDAAGKYVIADDVSIENIEAKIETGFNNKNLKKALKKHLGLTQRRRLVTMKRLLEKMHEQNTPNLS